MRKIQCVTHLNLKIRQKECLGLYGILFICSFQFKESPLHTPLSGQTATNCAIPPSNASTLLIYKGKDFPLWPCNESLLTKTLFRNSRLIFLIQHTESCKENEHRRFIICKKVKPIFKKYSYVLRFGLSLALGLGGNQHPSLHLPYSQSTNEIQTEGDLHFCHHGCPI